MKAKPRVVQFCSFSLLLLYAYIVYVDRVRYKTGSNHIWPKNNVEQDWIWEQTSFDNNSVQILKLGTAGEIQRY